MRDRLTSAGGLAAYLALFALACSCRNILAIQSSNTYSAPSNAIADPTAKPTLGAELQVPSSRAELQRVVADLDNDGALEYITVCQVGQQIEIRIAPQANTRDAWHTSLPAGVDFVSLYTQDVNADGTSEVLVEVSGPEANLLSLAVIRWTGSQGNFLAPQGGPSEGSRYFRSYYYPPWLDDLMGDSSYEILVSVRGTDQRFLDSSVYEWNGQAYAATRLYVVPPRPAPGADVR